MKETSNKHKNLPLILGVSIPILMIIAVAAAVFIPRLFLHPKYNFLYQSNNNINYPLQNYIVSGGHLEIEPTPIPPYYPGEPYPVTPPYKYPVDDSSGAPKLYLYNVVSDSSSEISFEDAQKLNLDDDVTSPDGYEVGNNTGGGVMPMFGSSNNGNIYLKGHGGTKKLNVRRSSNSYYYDNFHFLGWIK